MAIEQMKKVSIVVLNSERRASLKKLRKLGLLHLESIEGKGVVLNAYKEAVTRADKAISILDEIKVSKSKVLAQVSLSSEDADSKATEIVALNEAKKSLIERINQETQELERFSNWGSVVLEDFKMLSQNGIYLYMYEIPMDKYFLIGKDIKTILVNSSSKVSRFLVVSDTEITERPAALPPEAYSVPMPENSTLDIKADISTSKDKILSIDTTLKEMKKYHDAILNLKKVLSADVEFETVFSGMEHEKLENVSSYEQETVEQALENIHKEEISKDCKLAGLTGYLPIADIPNFENACKQNKWAFAMSDPTDDDPVPTKLKNNKLVSIIYPLTDFLDVTPGYKEFDISGWFLLFFCIFFAMIFADTGYGALIALVGFILLGKSKPNAKAMPVLVILLGLSTMLWGVLTCSWFGIPSENLPAWMVNISFAPVSAAKIGKDAADKNQQIFCFILALIQLSIAHIKCFIADKKSLKCLGDLGSLLQLWGMFYVVMSMVVDSVNYPLLANGNTIYAFGFDLPPATPTVAVAVLAFGFILSFIFSNYEGSIVKSILESCKNIISVLLGIVNVFSDIVSYIRLWAVALAGAAISSTVNTMAGPILGKLSIMILGVVLLVFGHGLNMILNVLSVIVHGVRLNTLEFSQHLGMTWSGIKYSPFREKSEVQNEIHVEKLGTAVVDLDKLGKIS